MKKLEIYIAYTYVGNYEIGGTGYTPKEALDSAWKTYRKHGFNDFTNKAEWLEYHGLNEESCEKITVGEGFCK